MNSKQNIDALLNRFIDGELTSREKVELNRILSKDIHIASRLHQLKNLQILVNALPKQEAPADILLQVKTLWEQNTQRGRHKYQETKIDSLRYLVLRHVRAAAAVIGLIMVLLVLIYTIVSPPEDSHFVNKHEVSTPTASLDVTSDIIRLPFAGKLELHCSSLPEVDHYIHRAVQANGLAYVMTNETIDNQRIFRIGCDKQTLGTIMNKFDRIWDKFELATLTIKDPAQATPIIINALNTQQIMDIVSQDNETYRMEKARQIAVLNSLHELSQGKQILTSIQKRMRPMSAMPIPELTSSEESHEPSTFPEHREITLWLTIVVKK